MKKRNVKLLAHEQQLTIRHCLVAVIRDMEIKMMARYARQKNSRAKKC